LEALYMGLRFYLFGTVRIQGGPNTPNSELTRTLQAFLAYLLLNRARSHSRDSLAGVFWGNESEERARSCLSTTLWRLRRALRQADNRQATYLVNLAGGEVAFNRASDHWLDVAVFEEKAGIALAPNFSKLRADQITELESAVDLYTGDAVGDFYDDWALREKERLRLLYLNSLWCLMRYYTLHGGHDESISYGQRILYHDPLREEIHRALIRLYLASGQRPLAIRQYDTCRELLQE